MTGVLRRTAGPGWASIGATLLLVLGPLVGALLGLRDTVFATPFHTFVEGAGGPVQLATPVLAAVVGAQPLVRWRLDNAVELVRTRADLRSFVTAKAIEGVLRAVCAVGAGVALAFIVMMYVVPVLGYEYHPHSYGIHPGGELAADVRRVTMGSLFRIHPLLFLLWTVAWQGAWVAVIVALAVIGVIATPRPVLSLLLPFGLLVVVSVLLATIRLETFAPLFSLYPFALERFPAWRMAVPLVVTACLTALGLVQALRRLPHLPKVESRAG